MVATLEFVWSVLCSCYLIANKIEGYLLMIYWTGDTVSSSVLLFNLCWIGDTQAGQISQHSQISSILSHQCHSSI